MYHAKFVLGLVVVGGILAIGLGTPAFADEAADSGKLVPALPTTIPADKGMAAADAGAFVPKLQRADELIGIKVQNAKGEDLGKIEELVLTPHLERVSYAVLSFGGILGLGDKLFAVPFNALEIKPDGKLAVLDIDKSKLEQAQGFDKQHWPDFGNREWTKSLHEFYGKESVHYGQYMKGQASDRGMSDMGMENTPTTMPGAAMHEGENADTHMKAVSDWKYRKLSELMGMDVKDAKSEKLGVIRNVLLDLNHGVVAYAIIGYGGVASVGETLAPIPWNAVELRPSINYVIVNTDRPTLDAVAFKDRTYPDFNDRTYAMGIYQKFNQEPYWEMLGYTGTEAGPGSIKPWAADSEYNKLFDAAKIVTINGAIDRVGTFRPMAGARQGLRLVVTGDDGKTYTVHVGPKAYADQKSFVFRNGDKVTVTGSHVMFNDKDVLIATEIKKGDQTLTLRDKEGKPAWNAEQLWPSGGMERKGMDNKDMENKSMDSGSDNNATPPVNKSTLVLPPPC
jgi:sporulation protein YlmC with PRC-barrel domain